MNLGETIKKLRRDKDITQEQLAEYLNISSQAVSKWETNLSLPDITLIPMLANIFEVTSDMLLGINIAAKDKHIQEILDHAEEYSSKAQREKSAEILREGLKEYPNSCKIMASLMSSVWGLSTYSDKSYETQEERKKEVDELRKEVIYLGEKILAESTDNHSRETAIQLLCYTYPSIGESEKAEKLVSTASGINTLDLLRSIYSGDKKFRHIQTCIQTYLTYLFISMQNNNAPLDDGSRPYTKEELIIIYKKIIAILEIIFEDKNYGYFQQWITWRYYEMAMFYAELEDYENAMENLLIASEHAIKSDTEFDPEKEYTCLIFKGRKVGEVIHNVTGNDSMEQLKVMKNKAFDAIRENADFIEIEERLKKYAKKR